VKHLSSLFVFILCITFNFPHLYGIDVNVDKKTNIVATFQMKVFNDGWSCDESLLVSLKIYNYQNQIKAKWTHAYYKLFDESGIGVRIQQFTTSNDTITDLEVGENSFEFNLHYDQETPLKIIGMRISDNYHVEGMGVWWSANLGKMVNVKWFSVDQINIVPAEMKTEI